MVKIDFQLDYKKIAFGLSTRYTSLMENMIDDNILLLCIQLMGLQIFLLVKIYLMDMEIIEMLG